VAAAEAGSISPEILNELAEIAKMVPYRPCEESMAARLAGGKTYRGTGMLR
jgi:hypothetical protein